MAARRLGCSCACATAIRRFRPGGSAGTRPWWSPTARRRGSRRQLRLHDSDRGVGLFETTFGSRGSKHVTAEIEKSLLDLDFASLTRRTFAPSPAAWEDKVLYFLLL